MLQVLETARLAARVGTSGGFSDLELKSRFSVGKQWGKRKTTSTHAL